MNRRTLIEGGAATLAMGMLAGCAPNGANGAARSVLAADAGQALDAAAFHASRKYAETRFGNIAYVERGDGDAALFLHGFTLNGFQWRGAIERLSAQRRCIAPDFMGMGYTEVAQDQSLAPEDQAEMIVAMMDALSIPAADFIASDSGGMIAQLVLARRPERVRSLLLTNCDTEIDCPPQMLLPTIELARNGLFADQVLGPWLADKALARSPEGIGGLAYADAAHPTDEAIEYYFAPLVSSPRRKALTHAFTIALERNALEGVEPALMRSTAPVRIVWGMDDTVFRPDNIDYLGRVFSNLRGVRELEGSMLFWPEERPDVLAEEARALWDGA